MKILLVDDEPMMLEEMHFIVRKVCPDAEIICASNYKAAIEESTHKAFDVGFLDIEMPEMSGLELAKRLKDRCPGMNIIFATAYSEFAIDAFSMRASGYLLKPVREENVREELANLRMPLQRDEKKLFVQCFGNFELFYDGQPVKFQRTPAKEVLAYLIDLKGASANTSQICAVLWEDADRENRSYFRNIMIELKRVLKECHAEKALICKRNFFAIDPKEIECDYYKFLSQDVSYVNSYHGEYMQQYSWAEMTIPENRATLG